MKNQENSAISKELWQAYLETDFKVFAENSFTLKVGQYSSELNSIIKKSKYSSAAFITAYNPYSQELSDVENVARQEQLKIQIAKRGLTAIEGIGQHPSNQWLVKADPHLAVQDLFPINSKRRVLGPQPGPSEHRYHRGQGLQILFIDETELTFVQWVLAEA